MVHSRLRFAIKQLGSNRANWGELKADIFERLYGVGVFPQLRRAIQ